MLQSLAYAQNPNAASQTAPSVVVDCQGTRCFTLSDIQSDAFEMAGLEVVHCASDGDGGALQVRNSIVSMRALKFRGCTAASRGGALFFGSGSTVDMQHVVFTANTAGAGGGAVCAADSTLTVTNCAFDANRVWTKDPAQPRLSCGGALLATDCVLAIADSAFARNNVTRAGDAQAGDGRDTQGGALFAYSSTVQIARSNFTANQADLGGGIASLGVTRLIASFLESDQPSTLTVEACNFDSNVALERYVRCFETLVLTSHPCSGGGLLVDSAEQLTVGKSNFARNVAAHNGAGAFVTNSLVALNSSVWSDNDCRAGNGGGLYLASVEGVIAHSGFLDNSCPLGGGAAVFLVQPSAVAAPVLVNNMEANNQAAFGQFLATQPAELSLLWNADANEQAAGALLSPPPVLVVRDQLQQPVLGQRLAVTARTLPDQMLSGGLITFVDPHSGNATFSDLEIRALPNTTFSLWFECSFIAPAGASSTVNLLLSTQGAQTTQRVTAAACLPGQFFEIAKGVCSACPADSTTDQPMQLQCVSRASQRCLLLRGLSTGALVCTRCVAGRESVRCDYLCLRADADAAVAELLAHDGGQGELARFHVDDLALLRAAVHRLGALHHRQRRAAIDLLAALVP